MYCRVFSFAAEPAGRGPNPTCFFTWLNARCGSKRVVIFFDPLGTADGVGELATGGFTEAGLSVQAIIKPVMNTRSKPRNILIVEPKVGSWIAGRSQILQITPPIYKFIHKGL